MARVPYTPVQSVSAQVEPTPERSIPTSPAMFGGLIGQGEQRLGQDLGEAALQRQGMVNETLQNNADLQFAQKASELTGKFKATEGLATTAALPGLTAGLTKLQQDIRSGLPLGAQRGFDMLATRRLGYMLGDANTYAASEIKKASVQSSHASAGLAANEPSDFNIASDPKRFNDSLQNIDFQVAHIVTDLGYGADAGTGAKQNPDGSLSFDETTPQGQQGKAVYSQMRDQFRGIAAENRIHALADDPTHGNVNLANQVFQATKDQIPPEAQGKIMAYLTPKLRGAQANDGAINTLQNWDSIYQGQTKAAVSGAGAGPNPNNMGNVRNGPNSFAQPASPVEGVSLAANNLTKNYQGLTLAQIGAKWAPPSENDTQAWVNTVSRVSGIAPNAVPNFNDPTQMRALLTGIATQEKSPADRAAFTPQIIDQGIQSAATGTAQPPAGQTFQSKADFYRANYDKILGDTDTQAERDHPGDPTYAALAHAKVEQRLNDVIRQQDIQYRADSDMVWQGVNGSLTKGNKPATADQLMGISPQMRDAVGHVMAQSPQTWVAIERLMATNAKGEDKDAVAYGPGYWDVYNRVTSAPTAPNHISNPDDLYALAGPGQPLNTEGMEKLRGMLTTKGADKQAETAMQKGVIDYLKQHLSFQDDNIPNSPKDPTGMDILNTKGIPAFYKLYQDGIANGKTPQQLLSKDSPDFIGDKILAMPGIHRTDAEMMFDRQMAERKEVEAAGPQGPGQPGAQMDLMSRDGIIAAAASHQITRQEFDEFMVKRGFARAGGQVAPPASRPEAPLAGIGNQ